MSRFIWLIVLVVALVLLPKICHAVQPDEIMSNPRLEARARALSQQLRCMVCQNQSIDDSDAPLARDLRLLVRERIAHGDSDKQVMDFLVARYGPFVLLKPPLWFLPPLALAGGAVAMVLYARQRRPRAGIVSQNEAAPLTSEEQAELARIMDRGQSGDIA
jgi:cytochrome c-type biogenesis protein CcmH